MKERILNAIYKKLEDDPENTNLHRQITLLNKASICTIHSFCLDVIRNNFYEIDIPANFRIGDTAEIELLKSDCLEELFEQKYEAQDKGFLKLIETYTNYRGDEALADLVLNIYKYIQSNPFPEKWLSEKVEMFNLKENDFSKNFWGKIILQDTKEILEEGILQLEKTKNKTLMFVELEKFSSILMQDIQNLKYILNNLEDSWDKTYDNLVSLNWAKWPVDKKVTLDLKNEAKDIRDKVKKQIKSIKITDKSNVLLQDMQDMYVVLKELEKLVKEFSILFAEKKKEKNIIDFNDIEHFALKILLEETEEGIKQTKAAKKYQEKFVEIAIDEYQDSNLVQEYILNSISKGNNIFMVGDVKQSIYKFRQARPELFLNKYEKYSLKEEAKENSEGLKIQLFKNFRSRQNILTFTNLIFKDIMSKNLGDIDYKEEEYLNYGANYPGLENKESTEKIELNIIDLKEEETLDIYKTEETNENFEKNISKEQNVEQPYENEGNENLEEEEVIEGTVLEAKFVANKIKKLIESGYMVYDEKQGYRQVTYKDVCILLREATNSAPIYEKEISELDIPVFSDISSTYLDSMEVQIIMSLLKIIDNPMQDIPLVTVLRSSIGGFNDNELIQIRLVDKKSTFYEAMLKARLTAKESLKDKIENIIQKLEEWENMAKYMPLDELIWKIYINTGFFNYVSLLKGRSIKASKFKAVI